MNFRSQTPYTMAQTANINIASWKEQLCLSHIENGISCSEKLCLYLTLGKELTMWDDDPDIMDAYEEYDYECESDDGLDDLAFDSVVAADVEDDTFDKDSDFFDDDD